MHKVRSRAFQDSWRAEESAGWHRWNPFFRDRHRGRRRQIPATNLVPTNTRNDQIDHFDENPPEGTRDLSDTTEIAEGSQEQESTPANDSSKNTTVGATGKSDTSNNTRRRKGGLKGLFHKKNRDQDGEKDLESNSDDFSGKSDKHKYTFWNQIYYSFFNSWLNVLLVFAPIGIALHFVKTVNPVVVFVVNFIAIIPLAGTLSYATEEIALRVGETLGGLLNATFGNAVELIVSIIALFQDQIVIVQTSLIGSMLSNLLLVMGMCFFFGGINRKRQHFNTTVAQTAASLLALAIGALIIPTAFNMFANDPNTTSDDATVRTGDAQFSRGTSVVLLFVYICYLIFQLRTHDDIYNAPSKKVTKVNLFKNKDDKEKGAASRAMANGANNIGGANLHQNVQDGMDAPEDDDEPQEEEKEEPTLTWIAAIFTLLWSTVLVAVCAEFLVDAINEVVESTGISKVFVGLILLPIVGNAAEHATALTVACKDKMDLAIGVAVGSSMQIALLVLPLIVVIGWIAGKADMTLNFDPFDIIILFVSVLLVNYLIADGESHWLEGVMLMILYIIIALAAWFFPNRDGTGEAAARR